MLIVCQPWDGQFLPQAQPFGHQLPPACLRVSFRGRQGFRLILHVIQEPDVGQRLGAGGRVGGAGVVQLASGMGIMPSSA